VAAVTAGLSGDADSQIGGRRRRRRGSRRRSDRVGLPGEATSQFESGGSSEGFEAEDAQETPEIEITPTTSATELAQVSNGTVEAGSEPAEEPQAEAAPLTGAAAPRDRRRRTRRPVVASETEAAPGGGLEAAAPATVEPLADMLAGGEPIAENGTASTAENEPTAGEDGEAAPASRARPRRVAGASRGRRTR
jgi:hypothetical protein